MKVFVYGSLKRGFHNNKKFLINQKFVKNAQTKPLYKLLDFGSFPGMIEVGEEGKSIHGEIYEIDEECKHVLDLLEGVDIGLYLCKKVKLLDEEEDVYVYLFALDPSNFPEFEGDNWEFKY